MIMIRNMKMLTKMLMLLLVAIIFLVAVGLVGFIYMDRMARIQKRCMRITLLRLIYSQRSIAT